ncbi:MAG: YraN family protein [Gemmatimonadota bacterium]|nr:MAG: YraN family protein [Gemmatimonadota bacterium]
MPIKTDPATWTDPRHRRGVKGEAIALKFLESRGWSLLAHRFRLGRWEIDLIVRQGRLVAFVEVKTRRGSAFGSPLEAVTWHKRREIVRAARGWMDRHGRSDDVYRFDVVGVTMLPQGLKIQYVEDAFRPGWR